MGLFSNKQKQKEFQTLLFPGEWGLWLRGVSFRQDELRKAGVGAKRFVLVPEPSNKADKKAVSVLVITKHGPLLAGYLPKDEFIKEEMFSIGVTLSSKDWLAAVDGIIENRAGEYVVTLQMPKSATAKHLMDSWRRSV